MSVFHLGNIVREFHNAVQWSLKWNGQYSCLVLYKAEIVSVFPLGILLTEFHHSVQWCIKFGMVHFLV